MKPKNSPSSSSTHPVVQTLSDVGEIVRAQRHAENLRIDDAAALCGVSVDLLSRLENGKRVTADRLLKVLDSLGLSVLVVPKGQASFLEQTLTEHTKSDPPLDYAASNE
jgi:transcriptional regulator with XRE-family HTH domain